MPDPNPQRSMLAQILLGGGGRSGLWNPVDPNTAASPRQYYGGSNTAARPAPAKAAPGKPATKPAGGGGGGKKAAPASPNAKLPVNAPFPTPRPTITGTGLGQPRDDIPLSGVSGTGPGPTGAADAAPYTGPPRGSIPYHGPFPEGGPYEGAQAAGTPFPNGVTPPLHPGQYMPGGYPGASPATGMTQPNFTGGPSALGVPRPDIPSPGQPLNSVGMRLPPPAAPRYSGPNLLSGGPGFHPMTDFNANAAAFDQSLGQPTQGRGVPNPGVTQPTQPWNWPPRYTGL